MSQAEEIDLLTNELHDLLELTTEQETADKLNNVFIKLNELAGKRDPVNNDKLKKLLEQTKMDILQEVILYKDENIQLKEEIEKLKNKISQTMNDNNITQQILFSK